MTDLDVPPVADEAAAPEPTGTARPAWAPWWPTRRDHATLRPPALARHQYLTVFAFITALWVLVPQVITSRQDQFNTNLWIAYSIAGIGFYWMIGLAGRAAFCQTFMMALGGYASAWVTRSWGDDAFLLGVVVAMAATAVVAGLIAVVVRKAQLFFFAIATMAVTQIGIEVFTQTESFTGPNGVTSGISPPRIFGTEYLRDTEIFPMFVVILTMVLVAGAALERSPLRREAIASRDNPLVARASGVSTVRVQVVMFAAGSSLGGLAGAMIGHWTGVISTNSFSFDLAIGIFLMVYLGGIGSMWGPVIGAAFYVALPNFLTSFEQYNTIIYGSLLLVVILAMPKGLVGVIEKAWSAGTSLVRRNREASHA